MRRAVRAEWGTRWTSPLPGAARLDCSPALLLARAGHHVVVLERDSLELAPDVESAAACGVPPFGAADRAAPHRHGPVPQLLIERLPDVYDGLLAAGVAEAPLRTQMPESLSDTAAWPGDEQLTPMMTRRSTVDWVPAADRRG